MFEFLSAPGRIDALERQLNETTTELKKLVTQSKLDVLKELTIKTDVSVKQLETVNQRLETLEVLVLPKEPVPEAVTETAVETFPLVKRKRGKAKKAVQLDQSM